MKTYLLFAMLGLASAAYAAEPLAGSVKSVEGKVYVLRGAESFEGHPGMLLSSKDVLVTAAQSRVGIILHDGTRISLGPNSEIEIATFVFEPAAEQFGLVLKLMKGVAAYVSGKIEQFAPDKVKIETPVGIVGLRGTEVAVSLDAR